jgi:hypothetical protein
MVSHFSTIKKQYIRDARFENLSVIPYSRGRLVFSELVANALLEDHFDRVLVDLPYFMNSEKFLKATARLFPLCQSLIIKKDEGSFVSLPFVPNNAASITVAVGQILEDMGCPAVTLKCVDDSNIINYPGDCLSKPALPLKDDTFVLTDGLEKYFQSPFQQLEELWKVASENLKFFNNYRAGLVAERLINELKKGGQTLFVCEWRLWWQVSRRFGLGNPGSDDFFLPDWKDLEAAILLEDPFSFWAKGVLDDYPGVVAQFYNKLKLFSLDSFDKLKSLQDLIRDSVDTCVLDNVGNISLRKIISFRNFLKNRMTLDFRLCPPPVTHLFDSARSCMGEKFAQQLARLVLAYPRPGEEQTKGFFTIKEKAAILSNNKFNLSGLEDVMFLHTGRSRYSSDGFVHLDSDQEFEERLKMAYKVCPTAIRNGYEKLGAGFGSRWAVQEDYYFYEMACQQIRDILNRNKRNQKVERSSGSMGEGIDWKGTMASRATGENAVYIKLKNSYVKNTKFRIDEYTPITFLFENNFNDHGARIVYDGNTPLRNRDLGIEDLSCGNGPPPDFVYSIFYTYKEEETLLEEHLLRMKLSSITFLYTLHAIGDLRYNRLMRKSRHLQCRLETYSDPELRHFPLSQLGIAWGVKYAEDTVIAVAKEGWKPSPELAEFAKEKNVQIIPVPFPNCSPEFIERLRDLHFSSLSLKKSYDRDRIVNRFINL